MKALVSYSLPLLSSSAALAQDATNVGFRSLRVDAGKVTGEIRSFQGLNGPPSPEMAGLPNLVRQNSLPRGLKIVKVFCYNRLSCCSGRTC